MLQKIQQEDSQRKKKLIGNCRNVRGLGKSMVVFRLFENKSGLHTANLSWQTRVGKLKLVCVNGIKTVGKHVSI